MSEQATAVEGVFFDLHGRLPIFPMMARTRITHYLRHGAEKPDVVFFDRVEGWLGAYGELRYLGGTEVLRPLRTISISLRRPAA